MQRTSSPFSVGAAALAALVLAACSGDEAGLSGPGGDSEFDARSTASAVESAAPDTQQNGDLLGTLALVSGAIGADTGLPGTSVVVVDGLTPTLDPASVEALLSRGDAGAPAPSLSLLLPDLLLGKTLVWNPATGEYEVDPDRTGAPASGVRFVMYAINPVTGEPTEPLDEIGYVELVDESAEDTGLRLRVRAVDTTGDVPLELVNYFVEGSLEVAGESRVTLLARGFLDDGTDRLDFDLATEVVVPAQGNAAQVVATYALALQEGAAVTLEMGADVDLENPDSGTLQLELVVEDGGDVVQLTVAVDGQQNMDGTVGFNGETVVEIGGTATEPTFTRPDGSELTAEEREALADMVEAVEEILDFAESIFSVYDTGQ
jgi:hypothetical protein